MPRPLSSKLPGHCARLAFVHAVCLSGLAILARPLPAEPVDRQVSEWVLLLGGSVRLAGHDERVREASALPTDDFRVELVDLVGTNILPPDLQRLIGLQGLKTLNLPGPMWNPRAGSRTDYSRELRHLSGINTLEELTFSYTFLAAIKFQDDGIEEIAALGPSLRLLSLENTGVRGHHLASLSNLESLDLVYCPVDDEGLKQMQGLTKLRRLLLRDALISDEGLRYLSDLKAVEHLDLGATRITDDGVAHLGGMTRLKKLNLLGAELTDVGMQYLAGMVDLEELNLYGTRITNAGAEVLKGFRSLRQVDLRYTRVTRAGADGLRTALPECQVNFLDLSVRPSIPPDADRLVEAKRCRRCRVGAGHGWPGRVGGAGAARDLAGHHQRD